jgi:hypothetical protein
MGDKSELSVTVIDDIIEYTTHPPLSSGEGIEEDDVCIPPPSTHIPILLTMWEPHSASHPPIIA